MSEVFIQKGVPHHESTLNRMSPIGHKLKKNENFSKERISHLKARMNSNSHSRRINKRIVDNLNELRNKGEENKEELYSLKNSVQTPNIIHNLKSRSVRKCLEEKEIEKFSKSYLPQNLHRSVNKSLISPSSQIQRQMKQISEKEKTERYI